MHLFLIGANSYILKSIRAVLPKDGNYTSFASQHGNEVKNYSELQFETTKNANAILVVVATPSLQNARNGVDANLLELIKNTRNRKILISSIHASSQPMNSQDSNKRHYIENLRTAEKIFSAVNNSAILRVANYISRPDTLSKSQKATLSR